MGKGGVSEGTRALRRGEGQWQVVSLDGQPNSVVWLTDYSKALHEYTYRNSFGGRGTVNAGSVTPYGEV